MVRGPSARSEMRAGGMLRETGNRTALLFLLLLVHTYALPLQYLPEIPGYIPVYIRHGDQPLEEINPALAEAFHETSGILKSIREVRLDEPAAENPIKDLTDRNDVSLDSKEENRVQEVPQNSYQQKKLLAIQPSEKYVSQKSKPTDKESVVMKLSKTSSSEKIDAKKPTKENKEKDENK